MAGQSQTRVNPTTGHGRILFTVPISQGGSAGTVELVGSRGDGTYVKVVSYVFTMSAIGTAKFVSSADISGAMDIGLMGGMAVIGEVDGPVLVGLINEPLSLVTTGGGANGHLTYFLEK